MVIKNVPVTKQISLINIMNNKNTIKSYNLAKHIVSLLFGVPINNINI